MRVLWRISRATALCLFVAAFSADAGAQEAASPAKRLDAAFSLSAVTDYRYRGLSLSNKKPALQAELTLSHAAGVYSRLWGSTIAGNGGANLETQLTLGYYAEFGALNADVQAAYYVYPGASIDNYGEVAMRLGLAIGASELGVTASYAPPQSTIGDLDNFYAGLDGRVPLADGLATLTGNFGIEDGAFGDRKLDWSIGATRDVGPVTFGLAYVDTDRTFGDRLGKSTLVASVAAAF